MASWMGFSISLVNNRIKYIPIPQLIATSPRYMDPQNSEIWEHILSMTKQPNTALPSSPLENTTKVEQYFPINASESINSGRCLAVKK
jgi:hypothetical protein